MTQTTTIPLQRINTRDRRFCLSYPTASEALTSSIRQVGIIEPVLLLNVTPPVVICGFRRLEAARELGYRQVPCVFTGATEKEAMLLAIHSNIHRGLNMVEKAMALERLACFGYTRDEIFNVMGLLSLNPHEKVLAVFTEIARAGADLKSFICRHSVSMKNAESLIRLDPGERTKTMRLLSGMHITEGSLREVLGLLGLMKVKQGKIAFRKIAGAEDMTALRKKLREETSPLLSSLEKRLKALMEKAALPPGIDIKVDPFFEKEYIDILFKVKSEQDIRAFIRKLEEALEEGSVRSILELTQG